MTTNDQADDSAERRNKILGKFRLIFVWAFGMTMAFLGTPTAIEWAVGLVLAALGEGVRCWAAGYLIKSKALITGGPYAYVRNPLYLGRLLIGTGICVASVIPVGDVRYGNLVVLGVVYAVFFGYYMPRKERVEPARLEEYHGEPYRRYHAAVNSLLPKLRPYDQQNGTWGWDKFGRNREVLMIVALSLFFGWHALKVFGVITV